MISHSEVLDPPDDLLFGPLQTSRGNTLRDVHLCNAAGSEYVVTFNPPYRLDAGRDYALRAVDEDVELWLVEVAGEEIVYLTEAPRQAVLH